MKPCHVTIVNKCTERKISLNEFIPKIQTSILGEMLEKSYPLYFVPKTRSRQIASPTQSSSLSQSPCPGWHGNCLEHPLDPKLIAVMT